MMKKLNKYQTCKPETSANRKSFEDKTYAKFCIEQRQGHTSFV